MTRRTTLRRKALARDMRRVHELHIEALFEFRREFVQGWRHGIHVVMTDRAHRLLLRIRELTYVTADARIVTRELEIGSLPFTPVTRVTFELRMLRNRVRELLERFV